jgi:Sulfotransferase family
MHGGVPAVNVEQNSVSGSLSSVPLFVVGVWRSGTSLLYTLLNQHPQIALLYEGDIPILGPFFWPVLRSRWFSRWDFWNGAGSRHQLDSLNLPAKPATAREATEAIYKNYAAARGATIWGEKSPTFFDQLGFLSGEYPGARFIIIWRNPAGIGRSIVRAAQDSVWFRRPGTLLRALLGCREMKRQCDDLVARGIPVHQIQYEDLTAKPSEVMAGICSFLQIPFDPRMASLEHADRSAIAEGGHHALVKSRKIVSAQERAEVLPPRWREKVERYVLLWRRECVDSWPPYGRLPDGTPEPGTFEKFGDWVLYRFLRGFDSLVLILYSFAPLSLLQQYRAFKQQYSKRPELPAAESTHSGP